MKRFRLFVAWLLMVIGSFVTLLGLVSLIVSLLRDNVMDAVTLCVLGGLLLGLGSLIHVLHELSANIGGFASSSSFVARTAKDLRKLEQVGS